MIRQTRILGISGSLRRESYNSAALRAAAGLAPEGATVETFALDGIPLFNQDEEQDLPAKVVELKRRVREADALLFVTTGGAVTFPPACSPGLFSAECRSDETSDSQGV